MSLRFIYTTLLVIILSSCVKAHYSNTGTTCRNNCRLEHSFCTRACSDCNQNRAKTAYARYVKQTLLQGFIHINSLQSYDDPLKCKENSCDCAADYVDCRSLCDKKMLKVNNQSGI